MDFLRRTLVRRQLQKNYPAIQDCPPCRLAIHPLLRQESPLYKVLAGSGHTIRDLSGLAVSGGILAPLLQFVFQ
jgi:hypothetical protein